MKEERQSLQEDRHTEGSAHVCDGVQCRKDDFSFMRDNNRGLSWGDWETWGTEKTGPPWDSFGHFPWDTEGGGTLVRVLLGSLSTSALPCP